MNNKDLEYLRKMEEEASKRAFSKDEVEEVHNCLRTNVGANDTNEALDLSASIAQAQVEKYGTDVDSMLDTILYQGEIKGAEDATIKATETKFDLAAKFIDSEQYNKFESMGFHHLNQGLLKDYEIRLGGSANSQVPYLVMDRVETLKGAEYLVDNNIIKSNYFTDDTRGSIATASLEQLEYFVNKGANINAVVDTWQYGEESENRTILDRHILNNKEESLEYMKKIIELGGKRSDGELIIGACHEFSYDRAVPKEFLEKIKLLDENGMLNKYDRKSVKEAISDTPDYLQLKMDTLRERLGDKLGKTDKYSAEEAKIHINTSNQIMKKNKRGGMGE